MSLTPPDAAVRARARERLDALAKPVGSLGRLEEIAAWVASCQGQCPPRPLERVRAVVPAGDHGVVMSGVAAYPKEITAAMVRTILAGVAGVCVVAEQHGVPVRVLDISVDDDLDGVPAEVLEHKLARGSKALDLEDAMTGAETEQAVATGTTIFQQEAAAGLDLLIVGDLGIGNTTPSTALVASILGRSAEQLTGPGAGLNPAGIGRKAAVIQRALDRTVDVADPLDRLAALGSHDIAVAVGIMLAAARAGVPVLLDGVISVAEALVAETIEPGAKAWFAAGHQSPEPAQAVALDALGLTPILHLDMRLGEGSGAMAAVPIVRSAVLILRNMALLADLLPAAP